MCSSLQMRYCEAMYLFQLHSFLQKTLVKLVCNLGMNLTTEGSNDHTTFPTLSCDLAWNLRGKTWYYKTTSNPTHVMFVKVWFHARFSQQNAKYFVCFFWNDSNRSNLFKLMQFYKNRRNILPNTVKRPWTNSFQDSGKWKFYLLQCTVFWGLSATKSENV